MQSRGKFIWHIKTLKISGISYSKISPRKGEPGPDPELFIPFNKYKLTKHKSKHIQALNKYTGKNHLSKYLVYNVFTVNKTWHSSDTLNININASLTIGNYKH